MAHEAEELFPRCTIKEYWLGGCTSNVEGTLRVTRGELWWQPPRPGGVFSRLLTDYALVAKIHVNKNRRALKICISGEDAGIILQFADKKTRDAVEELVCKYWAEVKAEAAVAASHAQSGGGGGNSNGSFFSPPVMLRQVKCRTCEIHEIRARLGSNKRLWTSYALEDGWYLVDFVEFYRPHFRSVGRMQRHRLPCNDGECFVYPDDLGLETVPGLDVPGSDDY